MAFSSEKKARSLAGTLVMEVHSFDADSVTTGDIGTGIKNIFHVAINNETSGDVAGQKAVADGPKVTLSGLNADDVGSIVVIGY